MVMAQIRGYEDASRMEVYMRWAVFFLIVVSAAYAQDADAQAKVSTRTDYILRKLQKEVCEGNVQVSCRWDIIKEDKLQLVVSLPLFSGCREHYCRQQCTDRLTKIESKCSSCILENCIVKAK